MKVKIQHLPSVEHEKYNEAIDWCTNNLPAAFLNKKIILWSEMFKIMALYKDSK